MKESCKQYLAIRVYCDNQDKRRIKSAFYEKNARPEIYAY